MSTSFQTPEELPSDQPEAPTVQLPIGNSRTVGRAPLEHQKNIRRIEWVPINTVHASPHNTRSHSRKQIKLLCEGYKKFGVMTALNVDENGEILTGQGRYEAAKALGLQEIPVVVIRHLTEGAKRAYRIADNKLSDLSSFDEKALGIEVKALLEINPDFQAADIGFDTVDVDLMMQSLDGPNLADPADESPPPTMVPTTRRGDLWELDKHRLFCGDATALEDCQRLVGAAKVRQVVTDPPYGCRINGHVSGLGKVKHREFVMGSSDMTPEELQCLFQKSFANMAAVIQDGCLVFVFIDWRGLREMLNAGFSTFTEMKNIITWRKRNAGMGSLYRSQTEFVTLWKHGKAPHCNNVNLGVKRYRSNCWTYDGVNSFRPGREEELSSHPTPKPVAMIRDALLDCSNRGDAVLDLFAGAGTILIAAEMIGRCAYAMELDPIYCDVAIRRWQKFTGQQAVLADSGETFNQVVEARHG